MTGVTMAARHIPGASRLVAWYDVLPLPAQRVGVVLAEMSSPGASAGASRLRSLLASAARTGRGPAEVLSRANRLAGAAATVAYAQFDPADGCLRYACAGHLTPLLLQDDGTLLPLDGAKGPLLGGDLDTWVEADMMVAAGGTLVCCAGVQIDALVEAASGLAPQSVDALSRSLIGLLEVRRSNGMTLLCLRLERAVALRHVLPARPEQLAMIRSVLRYWAADVGLSDRQTTDLLLATGEACANAIEHAYVTFSGPHTLELEARLVPGGEIAATVRDHGQWRDPRSHAHRGRGLTIIRAATRSMQVTSDSAGTTIDMRLSA